MKNLIEYIPKKYRNSVFDFHREYEDGYSYFLSLRCDGAYHLEGYESEYTIHEDTIKDVLQVLRQCIRHKG